MPPKKPVQVEPEVDIRAELDEMVHHCEDDTRCAEIVLSVVESAGGIIVDRIYERMSVPFLVESLTREMLSVVQMSYVSHDNGEVNTDEPSWCPGEEPTPAPVDSWARAAVPVRKMKPRAPSPDPVELGKVRPESSIRTRSRASTPNVPKAVDSKGTGSKASTMPRRKPKARMAKNEKSPVKEEVADVPERSASAMRELAEEEERLHLERVKAQFKGKEYSYDHQGKIVEVASVDPEKLPKTRVNAKVNIKSEEIKEVDPRKSRAIRSKFATLATASSALIRMKRRDTKNELGNSSSVEALPRGSMVNDLQPAPGVTLRDGGTTKVGATKEEDNMHMSRKEFTLRKNAENHQGTGPLYRPPDGDAFRRIEKVRRESTTKKTDAPAQKVPDVVPRPSTKTTESRKYDSSVRRTRERTGPLQQGRLPPPVYPQSTGHGYNQSYLQTVSPPAKPRGFARSSRQPTVETSNNKNLVEQFLK